jgi:hypothetical protein
MPDLQECDYRLPREQDSVWIEIDSLACYLRRTDEGVVVDIYKNGKEMEESIASTYAFFDEGDEAMTGQNGASSYTGR